VVDQLKEVLARPQARDEFGVTKLDIEEFKMNAEILTRALVKSVSFDGRSGAISLQLQPQERAHED